MSRTPANGPRRSIIGLGLLTLAGAFTIWACSSGGGDGETEPPPASSISLSVGSASLTVARGTSGTSTLSVGRTNFTGAVSLTSSGAPTGVTVDIAPSSLSGSATSAVATVTVGTSAAAGTYNIGFAASGSGVSSATGSMSLTIPAPAITVTAGSGTATVVQNGSTTVPISITRAGGYSDAVALAISGLPTGVTATFNPASIASGSTTSTLTLTSAANAAVGTAALTVTASGTGVTAQTATVNLTVTGAATPAITVAAAPAALSVQRGANGTSTITLTRSGGFAGDVALSLGGAPTGVTGTFAPATIAAAGTSSTLTLAVGSGVTPGVYNLTVTGTGTGVSNATATVALTVTAAPSIGITANPTSMALTAGGSGNSTITLARTNFTGDVALAASNLPAGVTASFSPATLTGATVTSTLTLTASAGASLSSQLVTITASGTGVSNATATIGTTVTPAQGYTLAATAVSAAQGAIGTSTVSITRLGGYTGAVTLQATGLPSGVTASFAPNATTGTTSTLTLTVGAGAAVGSSTITVSGTGAGLTGTVTTTFTLTVTAGGGGGGSGNITWTFCDPTSFPLWFAVQNGASGAWTPVTPTGTTTRVYNFTVNTLGGVAFAEDNGSGGVQMTVQFLSQSELAAQGTQRCTSDPPTTSYTATFANVPAGQSANLYLGGSIANVTGPAAAPTVFQAPTGTRDLLAVRYAFNLTTFAQTPDRAILRRNNTSTTIPTLDMTGAESFAIASAPYTVNNLQGETLTAISTLYTANGSTASLAYGTFTGATSPITVYGLPNAVVQAGDQHMVGIIASGAVSAVAGSATTARMIYQYNQQLAPRTVTLGAQPPSFTPTSVGGAYTRYSSTGAWQADYPDAVGIGYLQASGNSWSISMSRNYSGAGATNWTLGMPDFAGLAGFQNSWGLTAGAMNWSWSASGFVSGYNPYTNTFGEGASWRAASRTGSIP